MGSQFKKGLLHGLPIALGYLTVSFGFGISAVRAGLSVWQAAAISALNLTSAGQAAGLTVMTEGGTLVEMAVTQLIINMRYSLMALSLSQKLDGSFTFPKRLTAAYGITDEIFAVASASPVPVTSQYMYGLIIMGFSGWVGGTALGAAAGAVLPAALINAMGIMLYGMFIAIFVPAARGARDVLAVVCAAAAVSVLLKVFAPFISGGFAIIIAAMTSSLVCAAVFPGKEAAE